MAQAEIRFDTEREALLLASTAQVWRHELNKALALNVRYREALAAAGIEPPEDPGGEEALRRFRAAFEAAGLSDPFQHPELLADWGKP